MGLIGNCLGMQGACKVSTTLQLAPFANVLVQVDAGASEVNGGGK